MKHTHAIVTYSKVHYLLTSEQEIKLRDMRLDDSLELDGNIIKVRNIADVLTLDKYYETYPDRKPAYRDRYKDISGMGFAGFIQISRENALRGIIKGLQGYINSDRYKGTDAPRELLQIAQSRLAEASTA